MHFTAAELADLREALGLRIHLLTERADEAELAGRSELAAKHRAHLERLYRLAHALEPVRPAVRPEAPAYEPPALCKQCHSLHCLGDH